MPSTRILRGSSALLCLFLAGCASTLVTRSATPHEPDARELREYRAVIADLTAPAMEGRGAGTAGLDQAPDYLVKRFQDIGIQPLYHGDYLQPFEATVNLRVRDPDSKVLGVLSVPGRERVERRKVHLSNVIGFLPGYGAGAEQIVVVGAHYDHLGYGPWKSADSESLGKLHPGADDNASGVAGLLLLARRLAGNRVAASQPAERRGLLFVAFSGEEYDQLGSDYLVRHLDQIGFRAEQITAMINLDMIGRLRHEQVFVFGTDSSDRWPELLEQAGHATGLVVHTRGYGTGPGDQASFYRQGVPVLQFHTGLHEDYHRPSDTADRINAPGALCLMDMVGKLVELLITDPQTVRFKAAN